MAAGRATPPHPRTRITVSAVRPRRTALPRARLVRLQGAAPRLPPEFRSSSAPGHQVAFDSDRSLGFAVLVAGLEDRLGIDPFTVAEEAFFPVTLGEFVKTALRPQNWIVFG